MMLPYLRMIRKGGNIYETFIERTKEEVQYRYQKRI